MKKRAWALLAFAISCGKPDPDNYQSVADRIMVIIPRGATYYQALDSLESRGVIKNRDWFSLYARMRRLPLFRLDGSRRIRAYRLNQSRFLITPRDSRESSAW